MVIIHLLVQEEAAAALIALSSAAAAQLVVDAAALVALGADDVQSAHRLDVRPHRQAVQRGEADVVEDLGELLGVQRIGLLLGELRALDAPLAEEHEPKRRRVLALDRVLAERALGEVAIAEPDDLIIRHLSPRLLRRDIAERVKTSILACAKSQGWLRDVERLRVNKAKPRSERTNDRPRGRGYS